MCVIFNLCNILETVLKTSYSSFMIKRRPFEFHAFMLQNIMQCSDNSPNNVDCLYAIRKHNTYSILNFKILNYIVFL